MSVQSVFTSTLIFPPDRTARKSTYSFQCPESHETVQLVVSKREVENRTYAVFITFLGLENERSKWAVALTKRLEDKPQSRGYALFTGSRSFSFRVVGAAQNYIQIKEKDENGCILRYADLNNKVSYLYKTLPPPAIQNLIKKAREFETECYKDILFNDSVVVMALTDADKNCQIYAGDTHALYERTSLAAKHATCGMMGIKVRFNHAWHSLEILPFFTSADVSEKDIKWNGEQLFCAK